MEWAIFIAATGLLALVAAKALLRFRFGWIAASGLLALYALWAWSPFVRVATVGPGVAVSYPIPETKRSLAYLAAPGLLTRYAWLEIRDATSYWTRSYYALPTWDGEGDPHAALFRHANGRLVVASPHGCVHVEPATWTFDVAHGASNEMRYLGKFDVYKSRFVTPDVEPEPALVRSLCG